MCKLVTCTVKKVQENRGDTAVRIQQVNTAVQNKIQICKKKKQEKS